MAVYMIKQESADKNVDRSPTLESSTEIEQNRQNAPVAEAPESIPAAQEVSEATGEELMIKVDGPVGRVFTDALNKVLANESYMATSPLLFESGEKEEGVALQVYAWQADQINTEDVVEITNDISRHDNRDYVIAIEGRFVTPAIALLDNLSSLKNVKVVYSQEKAIDEVLKRVKK